MVRVLQVVGRMHYGGMETLIMNIYRNIDRDKIQFDFMVHYAEKGEYDNEIKKLGGKIYKMPNPIPGNFFQLNRAYRIFFEANREYEFVHVHLHNIAFLVFSQAKKYGIRCLLHLHNSGVEHNMKGYMGVLTTRLAVPKADKIFACSKESANYYIKNKKPYEVIKNGICAEKFYFNITVRNEIRKKLGLADKFVLLCTARFVIQKNHTFLIDIVCEMKKIDSNICLLLIGDGPLEDKIRQIIKQLSLEKEVMFLGARGDVNELLQAADCCVMPSLFEGLSLASIEAQTAGLMTYISQEALSEEACITDLIQGIPLSESAQKWAEKIYAKRIYERKNQKETISNSGFDIKDTVSYMEEFYEGKQRNAIGTM